MVDAERIGAEVVWRIERAALGVRPLAAAVRGATVVKDPVLASACDEPVEEVKDLVVVAGRGRAPSQVGSVACCRGPVVIPDLVLTIGAFATGMVGPKRARLAIAGRPTRACESDGTSADLAWVAAATRGTGLVKVRGARDCSRLDVDDVEAERVEDRSGFTLAPLVPGRICAAGAFCRIAEATVAPPTSDREDDASSPRLGAARRDGTGSPRSDPLAAAGVNAVKLDLTGTPLRCEATDVSFVNCRRAVGAAATSVCAVPVAEGVERRAGGVATGVVDSTAGC